MANSLKSTGKGIMPVIDPSKTRRIITNLEKLLGEAEIKTGARPVILCSPGLRLPFRRLIEGIFTQVAVLSVHEIMPEVKVESAGVIK